MKMMKRSKKIMSFFLCMMLIMAMALSTTGCNDKNKKTQGTNQETQKQVLGEGETTFGFVVVDQDGNETVFEIHTNKEIVGDALMELELIDGEDGDFGLYVKTVNGITADYDKDGVYWAFYVNDEYALTGVDSTTITDGDTYSFKIEK